MLLTGGTTLDAGNGGTDCDAVLPAELWTPPGPGSPGGSWITLNEMAVPRLYHSTAVLLPDGTVFSGGGGQGGGYLDHLDYEVFTPPYLCQVLTRPVLSQAPAQVHYGQAFSVQTPDASRIGQVNMIRLSSVTHSFNMNQRLNHLPLTVIPGGLTLTPPTNPNDCPPGHYLLFLLKDDGTPSLGCIFSIGPGPASVCPALSLDVSYEEQFVAGCEATATLTASSSGGAVAGYRWAIDGVYDARYDGQASISLPVTVSQPTHRVAVAATPTCGGADPTTERTFTTYFPNCPTQ